MKVFIVLLLALSGVSGSSSSSTDASSSAAASSAAASSAAASSAAASSVAASSTAAGSSAAATSATGSSPTASTVAGSGSVSGSTATQSGAGGSASGTSAVGSGSGSATPTAVASSSVGVGSSSPSGVAPVALDAKTSTDNSTSANTTTTTTATTTTATTAGPADNKEGSKNETDSGSTSPEAKSAEDLVNQVKTAAKALLKLNKAQVDQALKNVKGLTGLEVQDFNATTGSDGLVSVVVEMMLSVDPTKFKEDGPEIKAILVAMNLPNGGFTVTFAIKDRRLEMDDVDSAARELAEKKAYVMTIKQKSDADIKNWYNAQNQRTSGVVRSFASLIAIFALTQ